MTRDRIREVGTPGVDVRRRRKFDRHAVYVAVAVGLMDHAIEPLGNLLATLPIGPEHPGATAGAPIELFYQPDYLLPHHRAAWLLFAERLNDAASFAARLSDAIAPAGAIGAALAGHAQQLATRAESSR